MNLIFMVMMMFYMSMVFSIKEDKKEIKAQTNAPYEESKRRVTNAHEQNIPRMARKKLSLSRPPQPRLLQMENNTIFI